MSETYSNVMCPDCGSFAVKTHRHESDEVALYCKSCGFEYDSGKKEKRDKEKVYIVWSKSDIENLRPDWTEKQCQTALETFRTELIERSVEKGSEVLDILLSRYEAK
jgi:DNA-directed RNA polymerase subunit M/transcription elongation factor TFIIS